MGLNLIIDILIITKYLIKIIVKIFDNKFIIILTKFMILKKLQTQQVMYIAFIFNIIYKLIKIN
jgi:hypothetical protein